MAKYNRMLEDADKKFKALKSQMAGEMNALTNELKNLEVSYNSFLRELVSVNIQRDSAQRTRRELHNSLQSREGRLSTLQEEQRRRRAEEGARSDNNPVESSFMFQNARSLQSEIAQHMQIAFLEKGASGTDVSTEFANLVINEQINDAEKESRLAQNLCERIDREIAEQNERITILESSVDDVVSKTSEKSDKLSALQREEKEEALKLILEHTTKHLLSTNNSLDQDKTANLTEESILNAYRKDPDGSFIEKFTDVAEEVYKHGDDDVKFKLCAAIKNVDKTIELDRLAISYSESSAIKRIPYMRRFSAATGSLNVHYSDMLERDNAARSGVDDRSAARSGVDDRSAVRSDADDRSAVRSDADDRSAERAAEGGPDTLIINSEISIVPSNDTSKSNDNSKSAGGGRL